MDDEEFDKRAAVILDPLCCVLFFFSVGKVGSEVGCWENVGQLLCVH